MKPPKNLVSSGNVLISMQNSSVLSKLLMAKSPQQQKRLNIGWINMKLINSLKFSLLKSKFLIFLSHSLVSNIE